MRPGLKGINLTGWAVPRYKIITRCRVEEHARKMLLYLLDLLEKTNLSPEAIEWRMYQLREDSIAGLNYHTEILEDGLGIEREEEPTQRVKRVKKVREKKLPKRGGLFG